MSVESWHNATKLLTSRIVIFLCRAKYEYFGLTKAIKAPYFVVGNHNTVFDAFLVSFGLKEAVRYVTSDLYFRNKLVAFLAKKGGCIPKAKFVSDVSVIKALVKCTKEEKAVGLFPEGYRNWDGFTDELLPGTAKLVKLLKVPVVVVTTQGGYLSMPRWGQHHRRGPMTLSYRLTLTTEAITQLPVAEIERILTRALAHDDNEAQRIRPIPYPGRKLAQRLELILYCCPHCGKFETMISENDIFRCSACDYRVKYDEYGFLNPIEPFPFYYDTPHQWREFCKKSMRSFINSSEHDIVLFSRKIELYRENGKRAKFKKTDSGTVRLYSDRFEFAGERAPYIFLFKNIKGLTLSKRNMIDFYDQHVKYRFDPCSETRSATMWEDAYRILSGDAD